MATLPPLVFLGALASLLRTSWDEAVEEADQLRRQLSEVTSNFLLTKHKELIFILLSHLTLLSTIAVTPFLMNIDRSQSTFDWVNTGPITLTHKQ
jgi:hypothetical protein